LTYQCIYYSFKKKSLKGGENLSFILAVKQISEIWSLHLGKERIKRLTRTRSEVLSKKIEFYVR
jgi:hypothetical protein